MVLSQPDEEPAIGWGRWHALRRILIGIPLVIVYFILVVPVLLVAVVFALVMLPVTLVTGMGSTGTVRTFGDRFITRFLNNFTTTFSWVVTGHAGPRYNPWG